MRYVPKTWRDYPNETTPITADALNDLENEVAKITNLPQLQNVDLNDVVENSGDYLAAANWGVTNYPPQLLGSTGIFEVRRISHHATTQTWRTSSGRVFYRSRFSSPFSDWEEVGIDPYPYEVAFKTQRSDLDEIFENTKVTMLQGSENFPPQLSGYNGLFTCTRLNNNRSLQTWTTSTGRTFKRHGTRGEGWGPWYIDHYGDAQEIKIFEKKADADNWTDDSPSSIGLYLGNEEV